ncbi:MAG: lysophospholipid acyltransferase family protein [Thermocrispum sp.]
MAEREKGGPWVTAVATIFYPLSYLARRDFRHGDRIPRQGGALLAFNHISHADPAFDAVFVHRNGRIPRFLAKAGVMASPVFGRLARGAGSIAVHRGTSAAGDALREAHQALREDKVVVIYPEGTITKDPLGWPKNSFTGVAKLALAGDVPVIPVARWGSSELFDFYHRRFRPLPRKTITYLVGEPIDLTPYRARKQTAAVEREVTELIMAEVTRLLAEIRDEQPQAHQAETPDSKVADA